MRSLAEIIRSVLPRGFDHRTSTDAENSQLIEDVNRAINNEYWKQGDAEYVAYEQNMRTCRHCGHVAEFRSLECPVCGKFRIGLT